MALPALLSSELFLVESGRETAVSQQPSPSQFPKLRLRSCWLLVYSVSFQGLPLTSVGVLPSLGTPGQGARVGDAVDGAAVSSVVTCMALRVKPVHCPHHLPVGIAALQLSLVCSPEIVAVREWLSYTIFRSTLTSTQSQ